MKKLVEPPSLMRLLCGSVLAYWLAGFINPAFAIIAVLIAFFIPIFLTDYAYLDADGPANSQDNSTSGHTQAAKQSTPANRISSTSRLLREKEAAAQHSDKHDKDEKKPKTSQTPKKH